MRIVCQQTILMKYHALVIIFEKAPFEIFVCCKIIGGALWANLLKQFNGTTNVSSAASMIGV